MWRFLEFGSVAIVALLLPIGAAHAQGCLPPGVDLKKVAREAYEASSDLNAVIKAIDKAVGANTGFLTMNPAISLTNHPALDAIVISPFTGYRRALSEAVRKREPLENVQVVEGVIVAISPSQLNAPDIIKVVVTRDGKDVAQITSKLKPTELTNRMGAKAILHAGSTIFPCAAFEPGGTGVTLIPESGSNIDVTITASQLAI